MTPKFMRKREAAEYLTDRGYEIAYRTLDSLASRGGGPRFHKSGTRRVYPVEELDAFLKEKLGPLVRSTSEATVRGLFAQLTPAQQESALTYRGEENHGDPSFKKQ